MSKHSDALYLGHIHDAARRALRCVDGLTWDDFSENDSVQDGVIRQLESAGEAVNGTIWRTATPTSISSTSW